MTRHWIAAALVTAMAGPLALADDDAFTLASPDLDEGGAFPDAYYADIFGCNGDNLRPDLVWSGVPEGTESFAVTMYDHDAPTGSGFWHWVVYNLPADTREIRDSLPAAAEQTVTDTGTPGYVGPCPPVGREHRYTFRVHALSVPSLDIPDNATPGLAGFYLYANTIDTATFDMTAGPRADD
ncbi:hypothetical protein CCR85_08880 [Rhodothalassium salexigens]|uniref:YbhB/YbcL family Raf kinase inhibitor-like protein n=1 Tax=Rhodothalassium salexigens TaxID=1086 RepID=UPI0019126BD5|nr:YbhB/YbcL family Raf kinase inhibitor-like protein [Rhodothalassium salexigens]MBK5911601.1 hypothetical protein [Rhodothalassium salexigens]